MKLSEAPLRREGEPQPQGWRFGLPELELRDTRQPLSLRTLRGPEQEALQLGEDDFRATAA